MRVSLRWLSEYVDLPSSAEEVREALARLGHEVESITSLEANWGGVVIGLVEDVSAHPNADKVRLCRVSDGDTTQDVVCGAWNFEAGAKIAWARPGARLPAVDLEVGVREIRGVSSNGMICSERELGLGDDHTGILVLEDDALLGSSLESWVELPDTVFDVSITPNRPDAMSMIGLARDLAAYFETGIRRPRIALDTTPGELALKVSIEDPQGCYRFTARQLDGVRVGSSPFWMRRRLRAAGVRPISNVVDVTNYVMLELGHPLHAFDADRLKGGALVVRRATGGERLTTLDEVERILDPEDLVICDSGGPTSLAGTMGGAESEVGPDTVSVLLEAASWDPPTIMHMARRHGLRSEASSRFERGVDPNLPPEASARAAQLMAATSEGAIREGLIDVVAVRKEPRQIALAMSDVTRTLGPGFTSKDVAGYLRSIELSVEGDDPLEVTVPTFRPDLERSIDLVEEIARLRGYEWFSGSVPTGASGGWSVEQRRVRLLRSVLAGAGLGQAVNLSFLGAEDLAGFVYPPDHEARRVVRVKNPLREEESALRTSLLPGLLRSVRYNLTHGASSVALFEIGRVFFDRPSEEDPRIPDQPMRLGIAIVGDFGLREMDGDARPVDAYLITALWRLIVDRLGIEDQVLEQADEPGFHPGRGARVVVSDRVVGHLGELHPGTAQDYQIPGRVAVAEVDLDAISRRVEPHQLITPSVFPPVEFDLAFYVADDAPAAAVLEATKTAAGELLEQARVFDEYRPGDGRKSLAIRYVLRADHTLTNEEVAPLRRAMVDAASAVGAELRGQA